MKQITTIGLDTAKSVFQVQAVDETGHVVLRRQLKRSEVLKFFAKQPRCLVGMEACAAAHYWAREIGALGHEVKLMPPTRVKPYVARGRKNDAADAAACAEAVTRPSMEFVPVKTVEQQTALMMHRARQLLVEQRTRLANAIRAHIAEFGLIAAKGPAGFAALLAVVAAEDRDLRLPPAIRPVLATLIQQWCTADEQIRELDRQITAWHRSNEDSQRLATMPQVAAITASALVATAGDAARFKNGRGFAAWLGLVPSQNSTGGVTVLGPITKAGDRYVRQLLVLAATGMVRRIRKDPTLFPWFAALVARLPAKKAAVALANKLARIAWAIMVKRQPYRAPTAA